MSEVDDIEWEVGDAVRQLNDEFQQHAPYGGVSMTGLVGYHSMFNHDEGIAHAGHTALHAAIDELLLMEVSVNEHIVAENQGEVTPGTMATELDEQLRAFTRFNDRFIDNLTQEFEDKLRGWEQALDGDGE